jgi:hypothetical protein
MTTTAVGGVGPLPPIDYTSRDWSSVVLDLEAAIPTYLPEWTSTSALDFGIVLLELFSYISDELNYYVDRVANEAFLPTATQRQSVLNLAYLIDYEPQGSLPARVVMNLSVSSSVTSDFVLPQGSQFSTQGTTGSTPVIFELAADHTVPHTAAGTSITATTEGNLVVVQGVTVTAEALGASTGVPGMIFSLFQTPVIQGSVTVFVDEGNGPIPWVSVPDLIDAGPFDAVYAVTEDANGIDYVNFGDGVNGRVPAPQSPITATYRVGGGAIGNVGSAQITVDRTGTSAFTSVTNPAPATGGADPESIASIQVNAPKSLTAGNRCVTLQDYASVAQQYPGISQASATATVPTTINLYIHPAGGPYKTADLTSLVSALALDLTYGGPGAMSSTGVSGYLDTRKMASTSITVLPPSYAGAVAYVPIVLSLTVNVLPQYTNAQVEQDVLSALNTLFTFSTFSFGQRIPLSSVYSAIQAVPGVAYLQVTAMNRGDSSSRNTADGVTNATNLLTSATMNFTPYDVGAHIVGGTIPSGATILAWISATQVTLSAAATGTATGVALVLTATVSDIVCGPTEIPVAGDPNTNTNQLQVTPVGGL